MKSKIFLFLLVCISLYTDLFSQPTQVYPVRDYVSVLATQARRDSANNYATDIDLPSGAVYICGNSFNGSSYDLSLTKYSPNGVAKWTRLIDFAGFDDYGTAVTVAPSSDIYVVGYGNEGGGTHQIIIAKYDSAGVQKWVHYFGTNGNDDEAFSVVSDATGSYIYVCGYSDATGGNQDFTVLCYKTSSTGSLQWSYIVDGSSNQNETANKVTFVNGNVVAAGFIVNSTWEDVYAVSLDPSLGTVNWTYTYDGPANYTDIAYDIKEDGSNAILCGKTTNGSEDYYFAQISGSTGIANFVSTYDGYGNNDIATSLLKDGSGNYAVVGIADNGVYEYHTVYFDNSGVQQWVHTYSTNGVINSVYPKIATDTILDYLYVSGIYYNSNDYDGLLYQVSPTGNLMWKAEYDGYGNNDDYHVDLTLDGIGRIYLASNSQAVNPTYNNQVLMRYSQNPYYAPIDSAELGDNNFLYKENKGQLFNTNLQKEKSVQFYSEIGSESMYINPNRLSYVRLKLDSDSAGTDSLHRVDVNFTNSNVYARVFPAEKDSAYYNYFVDSITDGITVNAYRRLYVPNLWENIDVHYYSNTKGFKYYYVVRPLTDASPIKISVAGADTTYIDGGGSLIAETPLGNINLGKPRGYNITNFFGNILPCAVTWTNVGVNQYAFNIPAYNDSLPLLIAVAAQTGAATAGTAIPNSRANMNWCTYFGGNSIDNLNKMTSDTKGNFYSTGMTKSTSFPVISGPVQGANTGSQIATLQKFNKYGYFQYGTYFGKPTPASCAGYQMMGRGLTVDSAFNIYIVGLTSGNLPFPLAGNPPSAMNYTTSPQCYGGFIAKFDSAGSKFLWSSYYGYVDGQCFFNSIEASPDGSQLVAGGRAGCSSIPLPSPGTYAYFANGIGSNNTGFYLKFDTTGAVLAGSQLYAYVKDVGYDKDGNYYLFGTTQFTDNPVKSPGAGAYTQTLQLLSGSGGDNFIMKFDNNVDSIIWATCVGGKYSFDDGYAMFIRDSILAITGDCTGDTIGNHEQFCYVQYSTSSTDSTRLYFYRSDITFSKFNCKTGQILFSTVHGRNNYETGKDIVIDKNYNCYIVGTTDEASTWWPPQAAWGAYNQTNMAGYSAFVLEYNMVNSKVWLTPVGNLPSMNSDDFGNTACISNTNLFIGGTTNMRYGFDFPLAKWNTQAYFDSTFNDAGYVDNYYAMFDLTPVMSIGIEKLTKQQLDTDVYTLYPNPNSGSFRVRFDLDLETKFSFEILNALGQVVYIEKNAKAQYDYPFNVSTLKQGVYFLRVTSEKSQKSIKFVIQ